MEDIISQIIKIDQQAQDKINTLNEAKELHRMEFEAELEKSNTMLEHKARERINSFAKSEAEFIQTEKKLLEEALQDKIDKLVELHEYSHEKLERNIFKSMITPAV